MTLIYETENFKLESVDKPFVDRYEGAHVQISQRSKTADTKLTKALKDELEGFKKLVVTALKLGRKKRGVELSKIEFSDEGKKTSKLPVQIYCRTRSSKMQKYSEPIITKHKPEYQPLGEEDVRAITKEIKKILKKEKLVQKREETFQNRFPWRNQEDYSQIGGQKPPARQEHRQRA